MQYFLDLILIGLSIGMVYALVAIGLSFIYSGLDMMHFAHGEIYMLGAFFGLFAYQSLGLNYALAFAFAIVTTALLGALMERVFYRRLTARGGGYSVAGMGMIICGFGMSIFLQNTAFLIWGPMALPFPAQFGIPLEFGDIVLPRVYLWIMVIALLLMALLHLLLTRTRYGLAIRAVAHNKDIAYLMGINVPLAMGLIFAIGCGMAAAGGVLIAPLNYVSVMMGAIILLKVFTAAVVGGLGSLPGAIVGGLLVGVVESLGAGYLTPAYKDIYAFALLLFVLIVKPSGLFGSESRMKA